MSPRLSLRLSRHAMVMGLACFALGGWLWWNERVPRSALRFDEPVAFGPIAADADHVIEIPVTNTGSSPIRLVGLDNDYC